MTSLAKSNFEHFKVELILILFLFTLLSNGCLENKKTYVEANVSRITNDISEQAININKTGNTTNNESDVLNRTNIPINKTKEEWPKKEVGGQLVLITRYYESQKGIFSTGSYGHSFDQEPEGTFFTFSNIKINAEPGVHYFYRNGGSAKIYSRKWFDGWNLRINLTDLGDKYGIKYTYPEFYQDEDELKEMISDYRNKQLVSFNLSTIYVGTDYRTSKYNHYLEDERLISNWNWYWGPCGTRHRVTSYNYSKAELLNNVIEVMLSLNYTNEKYYYTSSGTGYIGYPESEEEITLIFSDNSTLKVSYFRPEGNLYGNIEMEGKTFKVAHSSRDGHFETDFHDAVMKSDLNNHTILVSNEPPCDFS